MKKGETVYSETVEGRRGNYHWPAKFDLADGYLGVTQKKNDLPMERVLLSPKQVKALLAFLRENGVEA